jgi:hypothetical protein
MHKLKQQKEIVAVIRIIVTKAIAQLTDFPQDFKEKALLQVEKLSSFGFRKAGSEAENKTVDSWFLN